MKDSKPIRVSVPSDKERKKRQREMILAAVGFVVVLALTWIELQVLEVESYLFFFLFNANFILLLLVLFVVLRNIVKLVLERRRNVLGSKLRTRLVLAFMSLSLVPTVLMFLLSVSFVQTSMDYWFKSQVEGSMEKALDVGQVYYQSARQNLLEQGRAIAFLLRESPDRDGSEFLGSARRESGLALTSLLDSQRQPLKTSTEQGGPFPDVLVKYLPAEAFEDDEGFWASPWPERHSDLLVGVLTLDDGYLLLAKRLPPQLMFKLDNIVQGIDEFKKLRTLKLPLKLGLYVIMGTITLLIIFGAMWFGFRLAKELSSPIQALAQGTERIAQGDLSVRLEDRSTDEFSVLVQSFNRMAQDLELSQLRITEVNERLHHQNLELEQRGQYMEAVLDNITAGVISVDEYGRVSTVNKAAAAMFNAEPDKLIGRRPEALLSPQYRGLVDEVYEFLERVPGGSWQRQIELPVLSQDRKLLINIVGLTVRDENGSERRAGMVGVFEDLTELEKMQRMEAWREVAKRIAHEIKNPLTPIKLSAQRLERKFGNQIDDPAFVQSTGLIVRQVEHLQQMVQEFSAFARLPEVVLDRGDPGPLIREVMALFQVSQGPIRYELELPEELPAIRMDREALRSALVNLVANATEALEGREDGQVFVRVVVEGKQGLMRIEVQDNGPGLSEDERNRIFEPYFSRKKGGTGLGLTIVKSIITDHQGYIRLRTAPGRGSVFIVELPL